jgi:hypothetical protein
MAYAGMCKIDKNLSRTRLGSVNLFNLGRDAARAIINKGFMPRRNFDGTHGVGAA